jgi:hypothetical protein
MISVAEQLMCFLWVVRVVAGSNTTTVALLVVGGDEKEVSNLRQ